MFNVNRPLPGPDCSHDYHREEVIHALKKVTQGCQSPLRYLEKINHGVRGVHGE
jgi:hypothetical protein